MRNFIYIVIKFIAIITAIKNNKHHEKNRKRRPLKDHVLFSITNFADFFYKIVFDPIYIYPSVKVKSF